MCNLCIFQNASPYKKQNEQQNGCLEDFVLFVAKGYFPLSNCEIFWMCKLPLCLDLIIVFPFLKNLIRGHDSIHGEVMFEKKLKHFLMPHQPQLLHLTFG